MSSPVTTPLSPAERLQIVEQALILVEQVYVHLPLKRAMHAVEPIQRLKLLKQHITGMSKKASVGIAKRTSPEMSERAFHDEMLSIFTHLRDLHTNYILPEPFRDCVAFLPFRIQEFFEGEQRQYVVTQVKPGAVKPTSSDRHFKEGVIITYWNGTPIHRAVEVNAEREAGSNLEARRARGLEAMTIRPMALSLPPDEEWVVINYKTGAKGRSREIRFEWQVLVLEQSMEGIDPLSAKGEASRLLGIDAKSDLERRARKKLFAPEAIEVERQVASASALAALGVVSDGTSSKKTSKKSSKKGSKKNAAAEVDFSLVSTMPRIFSFRKVKTKSGTFGYIRISTFNYSDDVAFINEFIRIAALLPRRGLIIDVRGNGGGNIVAGERLLQVLTPHRIDPERLHFINSSLTLSLCARQENDFIHQWRESIAQAVETGATFSQGFPLLPVERYNDIGQQYQGPVVLLINALCYSTTDIFTAGFQDHNIGVVLGTSGNTGAGGANVWDLGLLQQCLPGVGSPFKSMPRNASFRVAVRRTTRVGERSGVPVEDLGITPDEIHLTTKNDVLKNDVDLLERAGQILAKLPAYYITATVENVDNVPTRVVVTTKKLTRVDLLLNDRPQRTFDVKDGTTKLDLPPLAPGQHVLELRGFNNSVLEVSTRLYL